MKINNETILKHGLSLEEFSKIKDLLKRSPNILELGIFSAMWNEHCSYKSSKLHLKTLPTKGKKVTGGPGENAGIIDIGDEDAIVFEIESHNHPLLADVPRRCDRCRRFLRDVTGSETYNFSKFNTLR